jgi:hypothetical protein
MKRELLTEITRTTTDLSASPELGGRYRPKERLVTGEVGSRPESGWSLQRNMSYRGRVPPPS